MELKLELFLIRLKIFKHFLININIEKEKTLGERLGDYMVEWARREGYTGYYKRNSIFK